MELSSLAVYVPAPYQKDVLFDANSELNRDNCLAPFRKLKDEIERRGWKCHTADCFDDVSTVPTDILFLDMPDSPEMLRERFPCSRFHLLLQECEVVIPENWRERSYEFFESVFSWSPVLCGRGGKFIRVNFSQDITYTPGELAFADKKLLTMISGNKKSNHRLELYSARRSIIEWFESNGPALFDLYGVGWNRASSSNRYINYVLKKTFLGKWFSSNYAVYKGVVAGKQATLQGYRFCVCYENAQLIDGYVTEKIFDAMMAGCVPVYWGAPDITDFIPKECFVDRRSFGSDAELVKYLKSISENQHAEILGHISAYLRSDKAQRFSSHEFATVIADRVCNRA